MEFLQPRLISSHRPRPQKNVQLTRPHGHDRNQFQTQMGRTSETHQYFIVYNASFLISSLIQELLAK